jgi:glycerol transport system substrate-binding protein
LNEEKDPAWWLSQPGAPKALLANEKPPGETVDYDSLVKRWAEN